MNVAFGIALESMNVALESHWNRIWNRIGIAFGINECHSGIDECRIWNCIGIVLESMNVTVESMNVAFGINECRIWNQ
jgi:hypothetical protein